jgi:aspartate oxidase
VEFTREADGSYRLARCGGATAKRLLQVGDRTGHAITKALRDAWEAGTGTSLTNAPLEELAAVNGHWRARVGAHDVEAGTVVLAAGGRCYAEAERRGELSTNHPNATGEVTRIAVELGAESRDLDALQYHPNGGAWPPNMQGYSIPETTRSAVYLDTTRIPRAAAEVSLPYMLRRYRGAGIDPLTEKILTYPVLHYQNGGLVIDTNAETTLEGVYACGEIAGGTHGRNRMMGNSLLECIVFGRRAGRAAKEKAAA